MHALPQLYLVLNMYPLSDHVAALFFASLMAAATTVMNMAPVFAQRALMYRERDRHVQCG